MKSWRRKLWPNMDSSSSFLFDNNVFCMTTTLPLRDLHGVSELATDLEWILHWMVVIKVARRCHWYYYTTAIYFFQFAEGCFQLCLKFNILQQQSERRTMVQQHHQQQQLFCNILLRMWDAGSAAKKRLGPSRRCCRVDFAVYYYIAE